MLIRLISSLSVTLGVVMAVFAVFYAELYRPGVVDDAKEDLAAYVDGFADVLRAELIANSRYVSFTTAERDALNKLGTNVADASAAPDPRREFLVEAFEADGNLVVRGFTAPAHPTASPGSFSFWPETYPILVYRHVIDKDGGTVEKTDGSSWIVLSNKSSRVMSIPVWLQGLGVR